MAIGIGAADLPVDLALATVAVLGLLLAACLWWAYFGGDDTRAERALAAVGDDRRGWVAIQAFGYCHPGMLLGITLAAGSKDVITPDPLDLPPRPPAVGGVALFLVADILFRHTSSSARAPTASPPSWLRRPPWPRCSASDSS